MDLSMFDNMWLKPLSWTGRQSWLLLVAGFGLTGLAFYAKLPLLFPITIGLPLYLWLMADSWLPGNAFGYKNHLDKFFVKHDTDWDFMRQQYQSITKSAFMRHEEFIWSLTIGPEEVPIMFTNDGGCIGWLQLERPFPHIVVDALADNHWYYRQVVGKHLPRQRIQLEGDFPDYFRVYQDPGQQIMTLQILAPDRMLFLVDNLRHFDLEIQDTYVRLFAAHAQRSSRDFQAFMAALGELQTGFKLAGMNAIKD